MILDGKRVDPTSTLYMIIRGQRLFSLGFYDATEGHAKHIPGTDMKYLVS